MNAKRKRQKKNGLVRDETLVLQKQPLLSEILNNAILHRDSKFEVCILFMSCKELKEKRRKKSKNQKQFIQPAFFRFLVLLLLLLLVYDQDPCA